MKYNCSSVIPRAVTESMRVLHAKLTLHIIYPNHLKTPNFNGMSSAEYKSKSFPNSNTIAQSFKSDSAHKASASSSDLGIDSVTTRRMTYGKNGILNYAGYI